jgi:3,4-dihydroxy 2-butanone 4-phosphate synthase/GTP cyclohydrolase II
MCVAITEERADQLELDPMVKENTALHETRFTVSVDAKMNTTTGISASDRYITIQTLINPNAKPEDLARPGHIFPIIAKKGGILRRAGHTEAAVDLAQITGLFPAGVMCEIMDDDGTMARVPRLRKMAQQYGLKIISIVDLIAFRFKTEKLVRRITRANLPNKYGNFSLFLYQSLVADESHIALVMGKVNPERPSLVRVHSECLTGDVFGSLRCDCGSQLQFAMNRIEQEGNGVLLYLRQEGIGICLKHKIMAYELQDNGYDTVEANKKLGFLPDLRDYGIGAQILFDLGVRKMRIMTNNPMKLIGLKGYGLEVVERIPIEIPANPTNLKYLETKRDKLGHLILQTKR